MNFADFGTPTKAATATKSKPVARPVRAIRQDIKSQALNQAMKAALEYIMTTDGVALAEGQFDVDQSDKVITIRVVYNSIFGPELTIDDNAAQDIYVQALGSLEEQEQAA